MGMKAELVLHENPLDANFCSARFGCLPDGSWALCPHPFRAMAKAGRAPAQGFAGPSTIVSLMRDYSATPNFWPLHAFARFWLSRMGYSYEVAPSAPYDCAFSPALFESYLSAYPPTADGAWFLPSHPLMRCCLEAEGLIEGPGKVPNFDPPPLLLGLPPRHSAPGWLRAARAIREKLLAFWRQSDYVKWSPRVEVVSGDARQQFSYSSN